MQRHRFFLCCFLFFLWSVVHVNAQTQPESKYGKSLPIKGMLRILLVYAEIKYDVNPSKDPDAAGSPGWKVHELPGWKDTLLDAHHDSPQKGILTQFYKECSFDSFLVLGDYISSLVTINESEVRGMYWNSCLQTVLNKISKEGQFRTSKNLNKEEFDSWTMTSAGMPKITPSTDTPHKFDHVMFIIRNLPDFKDNSGMASGGSPGSLLGWQSDSYSIFRASNMVPFDIARHEFGHLLLGDNNFHAAGGQHGQGGANYFIPFLGGWGLLGGANSSFLTCNAWDRDRLDWKGPGKTKNISALNMQGKEVNADLDPARGADSGIYILRDFIPSGDAMRIRIPYLGKGVYSQWLWIENHQTIKRNKSNFDRFHFQGNSCIDDAAPGLYMYMQVDKNEKKGDAMYGGYGDYLRPITAEGFYDYVFLDSLRNNCINNLEYKIFEKNTYLQNPFTGNQDQESPVADLNGDGVISSRESYQLNIEKVGSDTVRNLPSFGDRRDAFTLKGNRKIGMGTNPGTAPMLTLVSDNETKTGGAFASGGTAQPNNRKIILNGLSVEILEEFDDGSIKVKVMFNDVDVNQDLRWCADTIILPARRTDAQYSLNLLKGKTITLDQGLTPTRIINPVEFEAKKIFASPTSFICSDKSVFHLEQNSRLLVRNGSSLRLSKGSRMELNKGAQLVIERGTKLIIENGAQLLVHAGASIIVKGQQSIEYTKTGITIDKGGRFKIRR